ncbi:hypothetical protein V6N13_097524 [Hibiscus sabdariffa]
MVHLIYGFSSSGSATSFGVAFVGEIDFVQGLAEVDYEHYSFGGNLRSLSINSKEQRNSNGVSSKSPQDDVLKESTGKKIMFNRIATIWGRLEALGESANLAHGLDRVTQLISTARMEKIEEMIVVEVGNEDFQVRVSETLAPEIE